MSFARFANVSPAFLLRSRWAIAPLLAVVAFTIAGCDGATVETTSDAATADQVQAAIAPARLGVYDSRSVALAYGRSAEMLKQLTNLRSQHQKAIADGDQELAAKLQKQGEAWQIRLNLQVFSNAPADDAIEHVGDQLAKVAAEAGVCAIVPVADYRAESTDVVDVTEMMVKLFDPTPETLKMALRCRENKPEPIEKIAQVPAANR